MRYCFTIFLFIIICTSLFSQKVGLVLSGGGARGLAHIGVIKVLEEKNIPIDYITGTSMGAIIAAMYASGMSADEMVQLVTGDEFQSWAYGRIDNKYDFYFIKRQPDASWVDLSFSIDSGFRPQLPGGFIPTHKMDFAFMEIFAPASAAANYNFDNLFIPFRCVASDVYLKEAVVFRDGDLGSAIRASMTAPFYFNPITVKGRLLFDGGIYNNFPVDVMIEDFNPDFIIGCKVAFNSLPPNEDAPLIQLENLIADHTQYKVPEDKGILIEPTIRDVRFMDFNRAAEIINIGYQSALEQIDVISSKIENSIEKTERDSLRKEFVNKQPPLVFKNIFANGIKYIQSVYIIKNILKSRPEIDIEELRYEYFRLLADDQIESIYPRAKYNPQTERYNLYLRVKQQKRFGARIGGNISSANLNMGFLGVDYKILRSRGVTLQGNTYFGRFYSGLYGNVRVRYYTKIPFLTDFSAFFNHYDFYRSSLDVFYDDIRPPFVNKRESGAKFNLLFPYGNNAKLGIGVVAAYITNNYYQTIHFSKADTSDRSFLPVISPHLFYEKNSLNYNQFATKGHKIKYQGRFLSGIEKYKPGSTSIIKDEVSNYREWFSFKISSENYLALNKYSIGYFFEGAYSNMPLFNNYTSTMLNANSFEPFPLSQTIYMPAYRANQYISGGLIFIRNISDRIHYRLEGYIFQPYRKILADNTHHPYFGLPFKDRSFAYHSALVYHTPIGPISLSACYFDKEDNKFYLVFNIGYLIFNQKALD